MTIGKTHPVYSRTLHMMYLKISRAVATLPRKKLHICIAVRVLRMTNCTMTHTVLWISFSCIYNVLVYVKCLSIIYYYHDFQKCIDAQIFADK